MAAVNSFAAAVNAGDEAGLARLFDPDVRIEFPAGKKMPASDFIKGVGKDLRLEVSGLRSAGWYASWVFDAQGGGAARCGLLPVQPQDQEDSLGAVFLGRLRGSK